MSSGQLERELAQWEKWEAHLLENQLSFPMLAYFRSQHPNQSWLTALVAITDCSSLVSLTAKDDLKRQADLTFAMACHILADTAVEFGLGAQVKKAAGHSRLSDDQYGKLRARLSRQANSPGLRGLDKRQFDRFLNMYQPHAIALSNYFSMSLPKWIADDATRENWRVPISERDETPFAVSDPFSESEEESRRAG